MIRLGICGCMINPDRDPLGIEVAQDTARLGYDYIELSLRDAAALSDRDFAVLTRKLEAFGLPCEACNNFYPPRQRITGPEADFVSLTRYTDSALRRARELGAEVVVFGSSGARNIPEGFPREQGWRQIVETSRMIGETAEKYGITIALEYHHRGEANVLTSMEEAIALAEETAHERMRLLTDYYHFAVEKESLDVIRKAGKRLVHAHFAELENRAFPLTPKEEYRSFLKTLRDSGYTGRLSIEAFTKDFLSDAERSLRVLRGLTGDIFS